MDCVFCRVVNKEIPAGIVFEDEIVLVFRDIHPVAPIHLLVIPKKHIEDFHHLGDQTAVALKNVLQRMVTENKLMGKGYKIEVNGGGAQIVNHLHFHLIGPVGFVAKQ